MRGGEREKQGGRLEKEGRKKAKRENKSNIDLELSNFRYHRNFYQDFVNKLQIITAKSTYNHTSFDKTP